MYDISYPTADRWVLGVSQSLCKPSKTDIRFAGRMAEQYDHHAPEPMRVPRIQ